MIMFTLTININDYYKYPLTYCTSIINYRQFILLIFSITLSLSKGPPSIPYIRTGVNILVPESGHTKETWSNSITETSETI